MYLFYIVLIRPRPFKCFKMYLHNTKQQKYNKQNYKMQNTKS